MPKFTINPVTMGNQPLQVEVEYDKATVVSAQIGISGFWDFDTLLAGKHPFDALQLVLRLNSHLSVAHGLAAARVLEEAAGVGLTFNGLLARNILQACEFISYHLYHFYQGVLFTFVPGPDAGVPAGQDRIPAKVNNRLVDNYWRAFYMRTRIQEMMAVLSGKVPHNVTIIPGGVSENIEARKILRLGSCLSEVEAFLKEQYVEDIRALADVFPEWAGTPLGGDSFLSLGGFAQRLKAGQEENDYLKPAFVLNGADKPALIDRIKLDDTYCWLSAGGTIDTRKSRAYSWVGAGRLDGAPVETGSLARKHINNKYNFADQVNVSSSLGRELTKAYECLDLAEQIRNWTSRLEPEKPMNSCELKIPQEGMATGSAESPAGPVIHHVRFGDRVITEYRIIDPIVFNFSPQDGLGQKGPAEQALTGLSVVEPHNPVEIVRVIRAFE